MALRAPPGALQATGHPRDSESENETLGWSEEGAGRAAGDSEPPDDGVLGGRPDLGRPNRAARTGSGPGGRRPRQTVSSIPTARAGCVSGVLRGVT